MENLCGTIKTNEFQKVGQSGCNRCKSNYHRSRPRRPREIMNIQKEKLKSSFNFLKI